MSNKACGDCRESFLVAERSEDIGYISETLDTIDQDIAMCGLKEILTGKRRSLKATQGYWRAKARMLDRIEPPIDAINACNGPFYELDEKGQPTNGICGAYVRYGLAFIPPQEEMLLDTLLYYNAAAEDGFAVVDNGWLAGSYSTHLVFELYCNPLFAGF